jgi:hypothetical protein
MRRWYVREVRCRTEENLGRFVKVVFDKVGPVDLDHHLL